MNWEEGLAMLPSHMQDGMRRYIENGIPGGSFMTAVLENNLVRAFGAGDMMNQANMKSWAEFLYNYAPSQCWGSPVKVEEWCRAGGLNGIRKIQTPEPLTNEG